jgi:hypothetical protein
MNNFGASTTGFGVFASALGVLPHSKSCVTLFFGKRFFSGES